MKVEHSAEGAAQGEAGTDRREFLRRAGIGGAVVGTAWAAPAILSLDSAHAAGTCGVGTSTFAWSTGGNSRYQSGKVGTTTTANIDIRIIGTTQSGVFNSGVIMNNWRTRSSSAGSVNCGGTNTDYPMGNRTSFYTLEMHDIDSLTDCTDAGTTGRTVSVTFGFFDAGTTTPHAVRGLSFSLLDCDSLSGNYRDRVEVRINGSASPASTGPGGVFTVSTITAANSYTQPNAALARFDADANQGVANNATAGNVTLTSNSSTDITSVTVQFSDIRGAAPQTVQWVGIGDLTFCKV